MGMPSMDLLKRICFTLLFLSLVGCGGGDGSLEGSGSGGGGTTPDDTPTIAISLAVSDNYVTGQVPVTVSATVTSDGAAMSGQVVSFATTAGLGAFSPSVGTALTNVEGIAEIVLTAGQTRGADLITASVASGEEANIGFSTQGDDIGVVGDININVSLVDSDGNPTDTITTSKPGKVIATVDGISSPVIVLFDSSVGDIPIKTAITDENNQASVDIYAGSALGAGQVAAGLQTGESNFTLLVVGSSTVEMGSGGPFEEGVADISLAQISAGGTTVVSVSIVDDQGALFTEPVDVNFSSSCTSSGTATLSSPITTSNGTATSTYLAKGCFGDDTINVSANAGGIALSASTSVNVQAADIGSIEFVSASPSHISILGAGSVERPESSVIIFRVLNTNGDPVNNGAVDFSLNTDVGGINLIPESATTDINGLVQTVVNSGSVSRSVRVTANVTDSSPLISTQSSNLIISTGIPDQDSFSISASVLNPEAWDYDGEIVEVTARLADAFNNPPPPTVVFFTTEGGSIGHLASDKQCTTGDDGSCTVTWRSQTPRPEGHVLGDSNNLLHAPELENSMGQKYGGRVTILATTIGEESFPDLNGNGRFDICEVTAFTGGVGKPCNGDGSINSAGDDIIYSGNDVSGKPYDLKEAFSDYNEDGIFNPSESGGELGGELEEPSDFNENGLFDLNDGLYNGVLCSIPAHSGCSTQKSIDVRDSLTLVMSGSHPKVCILSTPDNSGADASLIRVDQGLSTSIVTIELPTSGTEIASSDDAVIIARANGLCNAEIQTITYDDGIIANAQADVINPTYDNTIYIKGENSGSATIIVSDLHNQPMPSGTKVSFTATVGSVVGPSSYTWGSDAHNGGAAFGVTIKGEKEPKSGNLIIEIETPNGTTTVFNDIDIDIQ